MSSVDHASYPVAAHRVVTVKEAMKALSVSKAHIFNLIRDNRIHSVKVGDARRIPVEEIDRILREGC